MKADCLNCSRFTLAKRPAPGGPIGQCGSVETGRKIFSLEARNCDGLYFDPMTRGESAELRKLMQRDPSARSAYGCFRVVSMAIRPMTVSDIDGFLSLADPSDEDTIDALLDRRAEAPTVAEWVDMPVSTPSARRAP